VVLNLGKVKEIAEVFANGKSLGILWKVPFEADLTGVLKPGPNHLEIKITSLWPNRMIGDQQPSAAKRYTFTDYKPYTKDSPLLESGLLGPVAVSLKRLDSDRGGSLSNCEGIGPLEAGKARKVAVGRIERCTVLDGEAGKDRVHDQWARGLAFAHQLLQDWPVTLTGIEDADGRKGQPRRDGLARFPRGERTFEHAGVG
jgi:hypothetical protein